jgi:hypothetical protein
MPTLKYATDSAMKADFDKAAKQAGIKLNTKSFACAYSEVGAVYHMGVASVVPASFQSGVDTGIIRLVLPTSRLDGKAMSVPSGFYVLNVTMDASFGSGTAQLRTPAGKPAGNFPVTVEPANNTPGKGGGKSGGGGVIGTAIHLSAHVNACGVRVDITIERKVTIYIGAAWC